MIKKNLKSPGIDSLKGKFYQIVKFLTKSILHKLFLSTAKKQTLSNSIYEVSKILIIKTGQVGDRKITGQ